MGGFAGPSGPLTAFPNGISSMGVPILSSGTLPYPGGTYFVNETTGSDGNSGSAEFPLASIARALVLAAAAPQAGNVDQVIFLTGTCHTTATITWATNRVHLIGLDAPSNNARARISQSGSVVFSPLVNVTANGCLFANIATFHGFNSATTQICWEDSGGRNSYQGVLFAGMGDATAAAQAGSRSLLISGSGESTYYNCTFGLDTITRATAANATLELAGGTARNVFKSCVFQALCTDASDTHVLVQSGGMDRYALFDDCVFINCVDSTATALNAAISNAGGSPSGSIILNNCISVGATAIATTGAVYITQISASGATTTYIGLHAT
ncbi:MAG: hypothetical protein KGL39_03685 [Patescibacteria group bacterium]|nr:hypothetical protein [Patescibacteria group bacterium]